MIAVSVHVVLPEARLVQRHFPPGNLHTGRQIEPVRRSFRRHGSCTFTDLALLVPSGLQ